MSRDKRARDLKEVANVGYALALGVVRRERGFCYTSDACLGVLQLKAFGFGKVEGAAPPVICRCEECAKINTNSYRRFE
jgi:hypothetical protein